MIDVEDKYDNLRVLLNMYGPFDYASRPQSYADQNWIYGWDKQVWWMFIKSIFTRNQ